MHLVGEWSTKIWTSPGLVRATTAPRLWDLRGQDSTRLLWRRTGAGIRALWKNIWVPANDGLQRLKPRILLRDVHVSRGRQASCDILVNYS